MKDVELLPTECGWLLFRFWLYTFCLSLVFTHLSFCDFGGAVEICRLFRSRERLFALLLFWFGSFLICASLSTFLFKSCVSSILIQLLPTCTFTLVDSFLILLLSLLIESWFSSSLFAIKLLPIEFVWLFKLFNEFDFGLVKFDGGDAVFVELELLETIGGVIELPVESYFKSALLLLLL